MPGSPSRVTSTRPALPCTVTTQFGRPPVRLLLMPRKLRPVEQFLFSSRAPAPVVAYVDRLVAAGDGWLNLVPVIDDRDERPTELGFMTLLSGSGMGVTMITWVPKRSGQRRSVDQTLGISHVTGQRAVAPLAAAGVGVPVQWRLDQDHPRRGLIVHPPADEAGETVVTWALRAVEALEGRPLTSWRANVHLAAT